MKIEEHNRAAWDREVERGNEWTKPVSAEQIEAARRGVWEVLLTNTRPVPREWFPELKGLDVLCLASGGGQQAPLFAAAGARVTVLDNSPKQLAQDRFVADRDALELKTVQGLMSDLSCFADESFDLIFHPCSNLFTQDVRPVWRESFRVLRHGGILLAGFLNPVIYIFDAELAERGRLEVKHQLPYSDLESLSQEERALRIESGDPLEFGHTLTDQIGGQLDAGFVLHGFYEDGHGASHQLSRYTATLIATRAVKP
ncbi:MAG: class I SAM-dependent methyltransferase [Acidobacteria bacterium]|nr:class I SAM-dependent methyltransferase [Acidobacteriota bacterium]